MTGFNDVLLSFSFMETTSSNPRDTAGETHSMCGGGSRNTHIHLPYDIDLEITDESQGNDYNLDTEEIEDSSSDEDIVGDMVSLHIVLILRLLACNKIVKWRGRRRRRGR